MSISATMPPDGSAGRSRASTTAVSMRQNKSPWRAVFFLALSPLLVGLALVLPGGGVNVIIDIGSGLIGGSLIGLIFALVQYTMDQRNQQLDKDADLRLLLNSTHDLAGIDLSDRPLTNVYLRGKDLTSARLDGADLTGVDLRGTVLDAAVLTGAILTTAQLSGANARGADLTGCRLPDADLSYADLEGALLRAANLERADLTGAKLVEADLSRSWIGGAHLEDCDLSRAQLIGTRATGARFSRANLTDSSLVLADLTSAHLSRAQLVCADLTGATLTRAILIRANLTGAVFSGCSLAGANLTAACLKGAVLTSVDLTNAVMVGCDLRGADLTGAQLTDVQGLGSARTDADTRWPDGWSLASNTAGSAPAPSPARPPAADCRRLVVTGKDAAARTEAAALVVELTAQQSVAMGHQQGARVSLPLGARAPRVLRATLHTRRLNPTFRGGTARLRIQVEGAAGDRVLCAVLSRRGKRLVLPEIPLDRRAATNSTYPSAIEELAARTLDELDPRDGAPWQTRAHVVRSMRRWDTEGVAATQECRRELLCALAIDPLGPVVNYALGALAYNQYDEDTTRRAIEHFAVAHASAGRLPAELTGLAGLCLSGITLSNCQLYHRFGMETPAVLAAGRTAAVMAVATTRVQLDRVNRHRHSLSIRRNAMEGYALARYGEAFSQHVTEIRDDVKASIPMYEDAIDTLELAALPVPAVLFNNLGYQHMTLAGRVEPGPDIARYHVARQYFSTALERSPDLHFGWANLGNVDRLLGNPDAAEESYRRALEVAAAKGIVYPPGWNELACVLLELGRTDEAEDCHLRALGAASSAPVRARLRAEYGQSLLLIGRPDQTIAVAELGLGEDPDNLHCRRVLAEAQAVA